MGWERSTRRQGLPTNWGSIVAAVHARSGRMCEHVEAGVRCSRHADGGVDHYVHRDDHRVESLRDLCKPHHDAKTKRERDTGRRAASKYREPERHPGLT